MSKALTRSGVATPTLQEKLRASLMSSEKFNVVNGFNGPSNESCLLLDISGSMNEYLGANQTKIDELRRLAQDFKDVRRFEFSTMCDELPPTSQVSARGHGGTNMANAFDVIKGKGVKHCIILTDGMPDNPNSALGSSKGLRIDVFYVGPDPAPDFLRQLATSSGGTYGKDTLQARKALTAKVRALLPAPKGVIAL